MSEQQNEQQQEQQNKHTAIEVKGADGQIQTYDYGQYAGAGSTNLPTTGLVKFLNIVQSNSKCLNPKHERHIEGSQIGMFTLGDEAFDGDKGLFFIGIEKRHILVEKTKIDGTGEKVAEHPPHGDVATAARQKYGTNKNDWRSEKGNYLVESIQLYGVLFRDEEDLRALKPMCPAIIDFQRTKMRAWETLTSPFNKCKDGNRPPLFASRVHLTTKAENRKGHDYFNLDVAFYGGDFLKSLISPQDPNWAQWAEQCSGVAKGVKSGSLGGDEGGAEGEGDDHIPF